MSNKPKAKGLIERKLEDPEYKKRHDERYAAFKLEAQILYALEEKNWTYSDLAKATGTAKSNVSRDLKAGGILAASFYRINKIADALGMKLVALLIPKESERYILPRIEELVRLSSTTAFMQFQLIQQSSQMTNLQEVFSPQNGTEGIRTEIENSPILIDYGQATQPCVVQ